MKRTLASDPLWRKHEKRPPLKTFPEVAESLGVSVGELHGFILRSANPFPEPRFRHGGGPFRSKTAWYDPREVRAWWAKENAPPQR
jgi:hypothetical protein